MPLKVTISPTLLNLDKEIKRRLAIARNGAALLVQAEIKQGYRKASAVASEATVKSVKNIKTTSDTITIGPTTKQAFWIEEGRKPGAVPRFSVFKPILRKWAAFKGLSLSDTALYFISRKIRREGYKARHVVARAATTVKPKVISLFKSVFAGLSR